MGKRSRQRKRGGSASLVQRYLDAGYSANTVTAYRSDLAHFMAWGGRVPATAQSVARYIAVHADKLAYATLCRRMAAIHRAHTTKRVPSPVRSDLVKATLRGIRRSVRRQQRRVKPLLKRDLSRILGHMQGLCGARDRALLLVGFMGAFRRSELARIQFEDIEFRREGLVIHVRHSKTDQEGEGRDVSIPSGGGRTCAVAALKRWLRVSGIGEGAVFRRVTAAQTIGSKALSAGVVASIVKRYAHEIGLNATQYSGHSLRAGLVTSAAIAGAAVWQIKKQTGHRSDAMVARYIRESELFSNHVGRLVG